MRDEIRLRTCAYQTLYKTSADFGVRKMVGAEAGLQERREYIEAREEEIAKLTATKMDLEDKMQVSTWGGTDREQGEKISCLLCRGCVLYRALYRAL